MQTQIGRYQVIQFLGEGGAGQVYRGFDPSVKRDVAIKILTANTSDQRARFRLEAEVLAKLDHPSIVPIYDFGEHQGNPYIVMRFMQGGTLHDLIYSRPLTYVEIGKIIGQVAAGLEFAHSLGIVHRDIKPANILFNERGEPQIGDFGLSKLFTSQAGAGPTQNKIIGTPHYMSPEQAQGGSINHLSDIYSLGVVLFEICNGRVPFDAEDSLGILYKHTSEQIPPMPHLPDSMAYVINKMMAKDPQTRYQTAGEIQIALQDAIQDLTQPTNQHTTVQSSGNTTITIDRSTILYSSIGVVTVGLISFFIFGRPFSATPSIPTPIVAQATSTQSEIEGQTPTITSLPSQIATSSPSTAMTAVEASPVFIVNRNEDRIYDGPGLEGFSQLNIPAQSGDRYELLAFNEDRTWVLIELSTGRQGWMVANAGTIEGGNPSAIGIALTEPAPEIIALPSRTPTLVPTTIAVASPIGGSNGWIAHLEGLNAEADLVITNLETGDREVITSNQVEEYGATWSPDGEELVYAVQLGSASFAINIYDPQSKRTTALFENIRGAGYPDWSPTGDRIAFHAVTRSGIFQIFVVNRNGNGLTQLTNSTTAALQPNWSPDGREIAYVETESNRRQLMIMDASGGNPRRLLTDLDNSYSHPTWSPDGQTLAFHMKEDTSTTIGIHVIDPNGQNLRRLTTGPDFYPSWSPDGKWIIFNRRVGNDHILYRVRSDGSELTELWDGPSPILEAEWRP